MIVKIEMNEILFFFSDLQGSVFYLISIVTNETKAKSGQTFILATNFIFFLAKTRRSFINNILSNSIVDCTALGRIKAQATGINS